MDWIEKYIAGRFVQSKSLCNDHGDLEMEYYQNSQMSPMLSPSHYIFPFQDNHYPKAIVMAFLLLVLLTAWPFGRFLFPYVFHLFKSIKDILYFANSNTWWLCRNDSSLYCFCWLSQHLMFHCVFCRFLLWAQFCQKVICGKFPKPDLRVYFSRNYDVQFCLVIALMFFKLHRSWESGPQSPCGLISHHKF